MPFPVSEHFNGRRFFNPGPPAERGLVDFLRWRFSRSSSEWPKQVPVPAVELPPAPIAGGMAVTWIGHATFLLRSSAGSWLTDPVFSERIGPVAGWGPRRVAPAALRPEALPKIDRILISHDHFDHCDLPSLRALAGPRASPAERAGDPPLIVTPLNYRALLDGAQLAAKLVELDWWQVLECGDEISIQLVPARHWCRRTFFQSNVRLWGGYFIRSGGRSVYFAGDSGYDPNLFKEIGRRCGPPDVALLPIGAYEPRWFMRDAHMNPAEAVQAHRDLGARRSIAMHWGTFQLTDEAREAPVQALAAARAAAGIAPAEFEALPIGGTAMIP
jgi:L-ascorbate metabolism protein UlaG (beta-lactamase superfamily)